MGMRCSQPSLLLRALPFWRHFIQQCQLCWSHTAGFFYLNRPEPGPLFSSHWYQIFFNQNNYRINRFWQISSISVVSTLQTTDIWLVWGDISSCHSDTTRLSNCWCTSRKLSSNNSHTCCWDACRVRRHCLGWQSITIVSTVWVVNVSHNFVCTANSAKYRQHH